MTAPYNTAAINRFRDGYAYARARGGGLNKREHAEHVVNSPQWYDEDERGDAEAWLAYMDDRSLRLARKMPYVLREAGS